MSAKTFIYLPGFFFSGQSRSLLPAEMSINPFEYISYFSDHGFDSEFCMSDFKKYNQEPVTLLAWSMGGLIALELYKKCPHLIKEIIFCSSSACFSVSYGITTNQKARFLKYFTQNYEIFCRFYKALIGNPHLEPFMLSQDQYNSRAKWALDYLFSRDLRCVLSELSIPSYSYYGSRDQILSHLHFEHHKILNPRLMSKCLEGVGHDLLFTHAREVLK